MSKVIDYIKESYDELMNKVSWPSWSELQNSAIVVSVASLIIAFVVFGMDIVFGAHPELVWKGLLGYFYSFLT